MTIVTSVTLTENITLYAKWKERIKHTISFYDYNGENVTKTVEFYEDEMPFTLEESDLVAPTGTTYNDYFVG